MTPSQICAELLEQHAEVRRMVDGVRMCADRTRDGASVVQDLPSAIRLLADAVRRHNQREEHLLRDLIPTVDAWGQMRAEIMTDEHVLEHNLLHRALLGTPSELAGPNMSQLLDRLIQHMAREEEAFLNERVLRDDVVAIDLCDG
jgi:hemerythrin-like domain-containing protein